MKETPARAHEGPTALRVLGEASPEATFGWRHGRQRGAGHVKMGAERLGGVHGTCKGPEEGAGSRVGGGEVRVAGPVTECCSHDEASLRLPLEVWDTIGV